MVDRRSALVAAVGKLVASPASEADALLKDASIDELHEAYMTVRKRDSSKSDFGLLVKALKKDGDKDMTADDRLAALTVGAQEAGPVFCVPFVRALLAIAAMPSRRHAEGALVALVDLFVPVAEVIRKSAGKKKPKNDDEAEGDEEKVVLGLYQPNPKLWPAPAEAFADAFATLLRILEVHAADQIAHGREVASRLLHRVLLGLSLSSTDKYLIADSTLRRSLFAAGLKVLSLRLGDPEKKLASRVPWYLRLLWQAQPSWRLATGIHAAVFAELDGCIRRALAGLFDAAANRGVFRSLYYAMTCLVQMPISNTSEDDEKRIVAGLVDLYGALLEMLLVRPHFTFAKMNHVKKQKRMDKKDKHSKDVLSEKVKPEELFGRLGRLLLVGLTRILPAARLQRAALMGKIVEPLKRLLAPSPVKKKQRKDGKSRIALDVPFAVKCQAAVFLVAILSAGGDEAKWLVECIEREILGSPQLLSHRSLHPLILEMVSSSPSTSSSGDAFVPLAKRLVSLYAAGILQVSPIEPLARAFPALFTTALTIPDDRDDERSRCLWVAPFLARFAASSDTRQLVSSLIANPATTVARKTSEVQPVAWLSSWLDCGQPADALAAKLVALHARLNPKARNEAINDDDIDRAIRNGMRPDELPLEDDDDIEFSDLDVPSDNSCEEVASHASDGDFDEEELEELEDNGSVDDEGFFDQDNSDELSDGDDAGESVFQFKADSDEELVAAPKRKHHSKGKASPEKKHRRR